MATKTKKVKEEVIDLAKPEKITDSELSQLQSTVRTIDRLTADIGRAEVQKYAIMRAMEKTQGTIETMRTDFMKVYGTDNVNIQTGEIAYAPEPQENGEVNS
tara:strand:+ start:1088 stop:1393 length:306 start_codon:yes stop_codon:yes gene_type:complete